MADAVQGAKPETRREIQPAVATLRIARNTKRVAGLVDVIALGLKIPQSLPLCSDEVLE